MEGIDSEVVGVEAGLECGQADLGFGTEINNRLGAG